MHTVHHSIHVTQVEDIPWRAQPVKSIWPDLLLPSCLARGPRLSSQAILEYGIDDGGDDIAVMMYQNAKHHTPRQRLPLSGL